MRYKLSNLLWGLAFIVAGIGFAGNAFNLWDFSLFFDGWWTVFIIVPCTISILENGFHISNTIGLAIGVLLLLSAQQVIDRDILGKAIFPIILILIGISIIFGHHHHHNRSNISASMNKANGKGNPEYTSIFTKQEVRFSDEVFPGAEMNSIFGGIKLDLDKAFIDKDVVIDATTIFGGIEICVPSDVRVVVSSVPIFGGVSNKAVQAQRENAPVIYINATCIFGGIDIK